MSATVEKNSAKPIVMDFGRINRDCVHVSPFVVNNNYFGAASFKSSNITYTRPEIQNKDIPEGPWSGNELVIKGCEMFCENGVVQTKFVEVGEEPQQALLGIISPTTSAEHRKFCNTINDLINHLSTCKKMDLENPLKSLSDPQLRCMMFKFNSKDSPTFRDIDGNIIDEKYLKDTSIKFIPTLHIKQLYVSPRVKKIVFGLVDVTVTHIGSIKEDDALFQHIVAKLSVAKENKLKRILEAGQIQSQDIMCNPIEERKYDTSENYFLIGFMTMSILFVYKYWDDLKF